jgi:uncharacterized cupredoxin-like copper-binding protein
MQRLLVLVALVAALGACGGGSSAPSAADASAGKVVIEMRDTMRFQPPQVMTVSPGASATIELKNAGATFHNFVAPELGVATPVRVAGGRAQTITITAPSRPGTYRFVCNEPGHAEAGMTGEVVVR